MRTVTYTLLRTERDAIFLGSQRSCFGHKKKLWVSHGSTFHSELLSFWTLSSVSRSRIVAQLITESVIFPRILKVRNWAVLNICWIYFRGIAITICVRRNFLSRCFCSTPPIAFDGSFKKHWVCVLMELMCEVTNAQTTHLISITNKSLSEYPNYTTNNCPAYPISLFAFAGFCDHLLFCVLCWKLVKWNNWLILPFPCFICQNTERISMTFFLGGGGWVADVPEVLRTWVSDHSTHIFIYSHRVWTVSYNLSGRYFVIVWPWCR